MGQAKKVLEEQEREAAEKQAKEDWVAKDKGFVCERCGEAISRESWGLVKLCSPCQQAWDNLG